MNSFSTDFELPEVTIIDDFYSDLDWLFPHLEASQSIVDHRVKYAGWVYPAPKDKHEYAIDKLKSHLGFTPSGDQDYQGDLKLTLENHKINRSFVHRDDSINFLIYLSGKEGDEFGTYFYRHKEFNITSAPLKHPNSHKIAALTNLDSMNLDRWEVTKVIPFKKNRAVIFNGNYFHSTSPVLYGTDMYTGRITQNFFFKNRT